MNMDWVIDTNGMSAQLLKPDVNIFIDVPPEVCMSRLSANRNMMELYETLENLSNVRAKYFEAFEKTKDRENIFITNGNRSFDTITNDIWDELQKILGQEKSYTS
jgi:dTMP kinase